jgi:FkbM family methyltransferase
LTRDEIIWGYRYIMERDPRPDEIALHGRQLISWTQLREHLLRSDEFAAQEKVIGHVSKWVITEIFGGSMKIWIDLADKYVSFGCLIDNYEPQESAALRRLLRPGFYVADVGANVGWFSFLAAQCIGQGGRVTAVEPGLPTADYLRRSVRLNGLDDQITVLQNAVGNRSATVSLNWNPVSRNPGSARIGELRKADRAQVVEMRELDTLLGGLRVDCIKMDIEGAEGLAFAGAGAILQQNRPLIVCEINPAALRAVSDMSVEDLICIVRLHGYNAFSLEEGAGFVQLNGPPELGGREVVNVLLAHEERPPGQ